jgi:hypothetical protein
MTEQKKPTVNVKNATGRSVTLHLHQTIADDGGGRPFQGRLLEGGAVTLKAGHNAGIDKEFWAAWREQNKGFALLPLITAEDETGSAESAKE